jgi:hypothetical protein
MLSDFPEAQARNVAMRAVPHKDGHGNIPLPLGIIQALTSLPEFDPDDKDFNPFEIAELATNFPVFLRLKKPDTVSDDIAIEIARDRLKIDLGDVAEVVPEESFKLGGVLDQPDVGYGIKGFFASVGPLVAATSDFSLSPTLKNALREGDEFLPNTSYWLREDAEVQAALALNFGYARQVNAVLGGTDDPRTSDDLALYAGGRFKYLMGFAYADVKPIVTFTTSDTIFGTEPLDTDFWDMSTTALPDESVIMGHGTGLDIGVAGFMGGYEVGLGVTNMATKIKWKADRELQVLNDSTDEVETYTLAEDFDYFSSVPSIVIFNAAKRWAGNTLALDIEKGVTRTTFHLGFETIVKNTAVRTGTWLDANGKLQFAGGTGFRFWKLGLDLALLTSSSVLTSERAVDLALSLRY